MQASTLWSVQDFKTARLPDRQEAAKQAPASKHLYVLITNTVLILLYEPNNNDQRMNALESIDSPHDMILLVSSAPTSS